MRSIATAVLCLALAGTALADSIRDGDYYVGDSAGDLWRVDTDTASASLIGNSDVSFFDIAFDPEGFLFGVTGGGSLYSISPTTAASAYIGDLGVFVNSLEFLDDGTLYAAGSTLYMVDPGTGAAAAVGAGLGFSSSGDLAWDASTGTMYMTATAPAGAAAGDVLVDVDLGTGVGTLVGSTGFDLVYGIDFQDGTLFGTTYGGSLLDVNTVTGSASLLAGLVPSLSTIGASTAPTPEPGTIALFGLGALGALGLGLRRRRQMRRTIG